MLSSVRGIILCRLCTKGDRRKYDGDMPMYNKYKRRKRRMYNRKYKRKLKKLSKYSISVHEVAYGTSQRPGLRSKTAEMRS